MRRRMPDPATLAREAGDPKAKAAAAADEALRGGDSSANSKMGGAAAEAQALPTVEGEADREVDAAGSDSAPTMSLVAVKEETMLDAAKRDGVYQIVSDTARGAALIAYFLHSAAKKRGKASVRVRVPAAQERDAVEAIERVLVVSSATAIENEVELELV